MAICIILVVTFLHNILVIPYQEIIENVYFFADTLYSIHNAQFVEMQTVNYKDF